MKTKNPRFCWRQGLQERTHARATQRTLQADGKRAPTPQEVILPDCSSRREKRFLPAWEQLSQWETAGRKAAMKGPILKLSVSCNDLFIHSSPSQIPGGCDSGLGASAGALKVMGSIPSLDTYPGFRLIHSGGTL